jgi:ubiquinone/menaquinone biosynthesis C-methylase UbiE
VTVEARPHEVWHDPAVAAYCDEVWDSPAERAHRELLARLCQAHVRRGMSVLEVGCGTGLVYGQLVPAVVSNGRYTGVDVAEPMLAIARERYPRGRFEHGDAYALRFADASFGAVVCFEVLGHLPDIRGVIAELIRVARARVLFTVWTVEAGVEEGTTPAAGHVALRHRYSRDYVLAEIRAAAPGVNPAVTCEDATAGIKAYVLTLPEAA